MDFVTLGMLTIDDIVFSQDENADVTKPPMTGVLGGAGTYAVIGARLFASLPERIGWVVHVGYDFLSKVRHEIDSWKTGVKWIETPERATTRALNTYIGDLRGFEFLSPKIHVTYDILDENQIRAKVFHIIGTPERCIDLTKGINARRAMLQAQDGSKQRNEPPIIVWEPMENSCSPENLAMFREALDLIDIFSPNEDEFTKLLGIGVDAKLGCVPIEELKHHCNQFLANSDMRALLVRLGARGVMISQQKKTGMRHTLLPAYHGKVGSNVVDVTGGGNTFLGAYCVALNISTLVKQAQLNGLHPRAVAVTRGSVEGRFLDSQEWAAACGSVAASFTVEQVGIPKLSTSQADPTEELWNGESVATRLKKYLGIVREETRIVASAQSERRGQE